MGDPSSKSTPFRRSKRLGKLNLTRWKGRCRKSFKELGYTRVDEFIEDVRGRVKAKG
jgi:hypothetical protein